MFGPSLQARGLRRLKVRHFIKCRNTRQPFFFWHLVAAYLNGTRVPSAFDLQTLGVKVIGMISAMASSVPAGVNGPMIHTGAAMAGWISQGRVFRRRRDRDWQVSLPPGQANV